MNVMSYMSYDQCCVMFNSLVSIVVLETVDWRKKAVAICTRQTLL